MKYSIGGIVFASFTAGHLQWLNINFSRSPPLIYSNYF